MEVFYDFCTTDFELYEAHLENLLRQGGEKFTDNIDNCFGTSILLPIYYICAGASARTHTHTHTNAALKFWLREM